MWGRGLRVGGEKEEAHLHSPQSDNELIQLVCPAGRWRTEAVAVPDTHQAPVKQSGGEIKARMRDIGEDWSWC